MGNNFFGNFFSDYFFFPSVAHLKLGAGLVTPKKIFLPRLLKALEYNLYSSGYGGGQQQQGGYGGGGYGGY